MSHNARVARRITRSATLFNQGCQCALDLRALAHDASAEQFRGTPTFVQNRFLQTFVERVLYSRRICVRHSFNATWNFIEPFSYLVSLSVWLTALWSYHPGLVPVPATRLETDYEDLVSRTQTMMGAVRSHFAKAARP